MSQFTIYIVNNQIKQDSMNINSVTFKQFNLVNTNFSKPDKISEMIQDFCDSFILPDSTVNYSRFNEKLAFQIASAKNESTAHILNMLSKTDNEKNATAGLYLLNRIIDAGAQNTDKFYPIIARFNNSDSANIQTMLSGIYRKTKVPDAFGALVTMYLKNVQKPNSKYFEPNEEICGAILEYLNHDKETCRNFLESIKSAGAIESYQSSKINN